MNSLAYLSLDNNHLTGSVPASFSALAALVSLQLQNNVLTGSLESAFNSSAQVHLQDIQVSNNTLTGPLPADSLQSFVGVSNCFGGTLPATICSAQSLLTLELGALHTAPTCRDRILKRVSSSAYITQDAVHGTIPACVFQLPLLQTLQLSSNALTGSLPDEVAISPSIHTLMLSHNKLTGSIPHSIQERSWANFDLAYNRLSGTLSPDFARAVSGTTLALQFN